MELTRDELQALAEHGNDELVRELAGALLEAWDEKEKTRDAIVFLCSLLEQYEDDLVHSRLFLLADVLFSEAEQGLIDKAWALIMKGHENA